MVSCRHCWVFDLSFYGVQQSKLHGIHLYAQTNHDAQTNHVLCVEIVAINFLAYRLETFMKSCLANTVQMRGASL